jgi:hypothetical protein
VPFGELQSIEGDTMPDLVTVSSVEKLEDLKTNINTLFELGKYAEIIQSIGMHSILIDPEHMISDQDHLYHMVLNLIKKKINRKDPKRYSSWLIAFPALLNRIVEEKQIVTDAASLYGLASRTESFGPFSSLDEFYFWALDDRRLTLDQIVKYIEKTVEMSN